MCTYCYDLCACSSAGFLNPMEEIDTTCMVWPSCVFYTLWQTSTSSEAIITFMLSEDLSPSESRMYYFPPTFTFHQQCYTLTVVNINETMMRFF